MRLAFIVLIGFILTGSLWGEEDAPTGVAQKITLVASPDAPGHISQDRLAHVYWKLIEGQKLQDRPAPKIVVLHVSRKEAENAGVEHSEVNTDNLGFYQIWLVGKPKPDLYVRGIETVLRHAFRLPASKAPEVVALMRELIAFESASVDVKGLVDK